MVIFGVAEHRGPFGEGEIGGDDDRRPLVEPAYQVEQQLAARLGERQIAEFVERHQINAGELLGQPACRRRRREPRPPDG